MVQIKKLVDQPIKTVINDVVDVSYFCRVSASLKDVKVVGLIEQRRIIRFIDPVVFCICNQGVFLALGDWL